MPLLSSATPVLRAAPEDSLCTVTGLTLRCRCCLWRLARRPTGTRRPRRPPDWCARRLRPVSCLLSGASAWLRSRCIRIVYRLSNNGWPSGGCPRLLGGSPSRRRRVGWQRNVEITFCVRKRRHEQPETTKSKAAGLGKNIAGTFSRVAAARVQARRRTGGDGALSVESRTGAPLQGSNSLRSWLRQGGTHDAFR